MKKPICFVAMAFGQDDTDVFYEKQILPTLKRIDVKPVIINRRQSNDDINYQIFEQLDKADFCIADLTYTRPSVYFEAGYAQKAIPVIYTVRKDHLEKGQPDDLRIHFDLQMKPIIAWKNVSDSTFSKRLETRIKATFLKEWLKKQKTDLKYQEDEKKFRELSGYERHNHLRYRTMLALRRLGYEETNWFVNKRLDSHNYTKSSIRKSVKKGYFNYMVGYREGEKKLYVASVQSFLSPTKRELTKLEDASTSIYALPTPVRKLLQDKKYQDVHMNVIILCMKSVSASRIESMLPEISTVKNSKHYNEMAVWGSNAINADFYFITGIKSLLRLDEELKELANTLDI